jgi:hypothetical protein
MKATIVFWMSLPLLAFGPEYQMQKQVVAGGGGKTSDGSVRITGTIGQPVIGTAGDSSRLCKAGFWHSLQSEPSGVHGLAAALPSEFRLEQNYPNPFNPKTTIRFSVKDPCRVMLKVFDVRGREVSVVADGRYQPGEYAVPFDAAGLPSGIYVYRIRMGDFSAARKMALTD